MGLTLPYISYIGEVLNLKNFRENGENVKNSCFLGNIYAPATLTLLQGQDAMYVFGGLVIIHHLAKFGTDRLNSVQEISNVKVFRPAGRPDDSGEYIDSLLLRM
ncbi:hypothetical protein V1264_021487 [Littorina saxatilis]|uniref:Uncharacterized protein n=1 Tax=Littorina saxatilis TaxID=31220 RepID=A0AAN9FVQ7_9CAEN